MKANRLSKGIQLDRITTLPQPIIEIILCFLQTKEAIRTSILSREWRYKWTTIPKLKFFLSGLTAEEEEKQLSDLEQASDIASVRKNMDRRLKFLYGIQQVLLLLRGPIHKFTLYMRIHRDCYEVDQILLYLSRNHKVEKLKLYCFYPSSHRQYSLPPSVFLLDRLRKLHLEFCDINHKPIFNGFGCLVDLAMAYVNIPGKTLLHLLSNCPSLKGLCLLIHDENSRGYEIPSINELFKCAPLIEELITWGEIIESIVLASDLQEPPPSLIHLKYFFFQQMSFGDVYGLTFLAVLMKCSPSLEKIRLQIDTDDDFNEVESNKLEEYTAILERYSDIWLEHLYKLEIEDFRYLKPEMDLLKFILARSPNLKKVMLLTRIFDKAQEFEMLKILLRIPQASPVEIIVETNDE